MGSSASVLNRSMLTEIEYDEECKDGYAQGRRDSFDSTHELNPEHEYLTKDNWLENKIKHSSVWFMIHSIINTILVIKNDFMEQENELLIKILEAVMMNIDSMHNIKDITFEHGKLQNIEQNKIDSVKKILKKFYGKDSLIVINIPNKQLAMVDLSEFIYDIFKFEIFGDNLYIYL